MNKAAPEPPLAEGRLDQALARAGDGVVVVGADGRIVSWNRAAERIMGYSARETIGRACCDVFVGRNDDGNRLCYRGCHVLTLVTMGESIQTFDMHTRAKTGKPVWINVSILVVPANGKIGPLTVHLFRDVTATKELLAVVQDRLSPPTDASADGSGVLTRRELELLHLITLGLNTVTAAERLHVSRATIRNHVQNIFGKLGVHSRLEAVAYAHKHRLF